MYRMKACMTMINHHSHNRVMCMSAYHHAFSPTHDFIKEMIRNDTSSFAAVDAAKAQLSETFSNDPYSMSSLSLSFFFSKELKRLYILIYSECSHANVQRERENWCWPFVERNRHPTFPLTRERKSHVTFSLSLPSFLTSIADNSSNDLLLLLCSLSPFALVTSSIKATPAFKTITSRTLTDGFVFSSLIPLILGEAIYLTCKRKRERDFSFFEKKKNWLHGVWACKRLIGTNEYYTREISRLDFCATVRILDIWRCLILTMGSKRVDRKKFYI